MMPIRDAIKNRYLDVCLRLLSSGNGEIARFRATSFVALASRGCLAGALLFTVGGCSQLAPTDAAPAPGGLPTATQVGVCYTSAASTPAQVRALAADQCPVGTTPRLVAQGWNLDVCPILIPVRATFDCAAR